jgi:hypothetical protein
MAFTAHEVLKGASRVALYLCVCLTFVFFAGASGAIEPRPGELLTVAACNVLSFIVWMSLHALMLSTKPRD